jgi:cytochrome P450
MPPGLKHSLPFYAFKPWVKLGHPIRLFEHLLKTYGNIACYKFLGTPIVFVNDPNYLREILVNQSASFVKERTVRRMKILIGEGLITSEDPLHKRQRRIVAPAFHRQRIAAYGDQIVACADAQQKTWQPNQQIDIAAASMQLSLEIVARTLFNTEVTADIRSINDEVNTVMGLYNFIVAFPRLENFIHLPIPKLIKFRKSKARLDAVVNRLISERRKAAANGEPDKGDLLSMLLASKYEPTEAEISSYNAASASQKAEEPHLSTKGLSAGAGGLSAGAEGLSADTKGLSVGLQPHESTSATRGALTPGLSSTRPPKPEGMSDEQVRDEVLTIFLAGYETVANGLTWTWYLLSQNPEAEAKLHVELDTVLGTGNKRRLPTLADYPALRYTEQVFAESMRLYPPAWAMGRMSTEPVTLGPYRIPPGAHFFFSQYIMGRDPQYFPDPLRFDPNRFTPEAKARRPKFTYFPFGAGNRQCIGESFAWMEGVFSIATIAQRWRMSYLGANPPVPQAKITLRPRDPLMMQLTPR